MYTVRNIETDQDMQRVREMWTSHGRLMRTPVKDPASFEGGQIVGAFTDDNTLVGTLRSFEWSGMPYYSIGSLYIKQGTVERYDFSNADNPIMPIIDFIIAAQEAKGLLTWFYTRAISRGYHKLQTTGKDLLANTKLGNRYDRYVNEIVRAGTRSKIEAHDLMLTSRVWATPIMVVQCVLKNEHRQYGNALTNELEFQ